MKFVSVSEMIAIEKEANSLGLTYEIMMENAGRGLAEVIMEEYPTHNTAGVLGLVGSGNNGGDTLVSLKYLSDQNWHTIAYIVGQRDQQDQLIIDLEKSGGDIHWMDTDANFHILDNLLESSGILVDGLLGTGIKLPLRGRIDQILVHIQEVLTSLKSPPIIIAVDCPSGMDCDTGEIALYALNADLTVTMAAIKRGLFAFPAYNHIGDLHLVGIGLPEEGNALKSWKAVKTFIPDREWVSNSIPDRPANSHKGTFGTALIIAGSINYTGAALLAGEAAYRIGAGLVTMAIPELLHSSLAGHLSEATWLPLPHEGGVISECSSDIAQREIDRSTALLIGPGLGLEKTTSTFIENLFRKNENLKLHPPTVIDAEGIKHLKKISEWHQMIPAGSILTPHPGEMSVLTGLSTSDIQSDRVDIAMKYSKLWGHVVVLKGAFTVVASPDGQTAVIPIATPALARAGTGDVLAGFIVGLLAQGLSPFVSALSGAWIHAQAGILARELMGNSASVLAGDVISAAIDVLTDLDHS
jgi:NAD(P)H-hydrate epimerase